MSAIDTRSEEIMRRLNRPNNTFIPLIVRRLVPTEEEARVILELPQSSEEIAKKLNISKKSVDFHSLDGKPSFIFFLVVSSPDNPSLNLQILAAIAHLVRKSRSLLKKILEARNIEAILDVIREEEEKLHE